MRIRMLETRCISDDGFTVPRLERGQEYDVADTAACAAINSGWAVEVREDAEQAAVIRHVERQNREAVQLLPLGGRHD